MGRIGRSSLAVIVGFVAASVVMLIVEWINGHVIYPELGKAAEGVTDRETMRALMAAAPVGAFLVVLIGWSLGGLIGGHLAARIGWDAPMANAMALGALLTLAGIANNLMLTPPAWFWIPTLLIFLPAAWAGGRMVPQAHAASV